MVGQKNPKNKLINFYNSPPRKKRTSPKRPQTGQSDPWKAKGLMTLNLIRWMHQLKTMLSTTLSHKFNSFLLLLLLLLLLLQHWNLNHHHPQWSGLQNWRDGPLNHNRFWGSTGPHPPPPLAVELGDGPIGSGCSLAEMGAVVLNTSDPLTKSKLSHMAYSRWRQQILPIGVSQPPPQTRSPS